jgi:hypothetical protein
MRDKMPFLRGFLSSYCSSTIILWFLEKDLVTALVMTCVLCRTFSKSPEAYVCAFQSSRATEKCVPAIFMNQESKKQRVLCMSSLRVLLRMYAAG